MRCRSQLGRPRFNYFAPRTGLNCYENSHDCAGATYALQSNLVHVGANLFRTRRADPCDDMQSLGHTVIVFASISALHMYTLYHRVQCHVHVHNVVVQVHGQDPVSGPIC